MMFVCLIRAAYGFIVEMLGYGVFLWCSNNAMDIWSKIKGKGTAFNNPRSVGEVFTFTFTFLSLNSFVLGDNGFCVGFELVAVMTGCFNFCRPSWQIFLNPI